MRIDVVNITILIPILLGDILLLFVVLRRANKRLDRLLFAATILGSILWIITNFLSDAIINYSVALVITKAIFVVSTIFAWSLLEFVILFSQKQVIIRPIPTSILALPIIVSSIISATPLVVEDIVQHSWGVEVVFGELVLLYVIPFVSYIFAALIYLFIKFKHSAGTTRRQFGYVFWGYFLFIVSALLTNLVIPLITNSFVQTKYGPLFTLVFLGLTTYAILKHRLLDIRVAITRSLIFGILVTLIALSFVLTTFLSAQIFGDTSGSRIAISFVAAVIIVVGFEPLKRLLSRATDKIFFKARIDYGTALRQLTEILSVELNLGRLITSLTTTLQDQLKIKSAAIALRKPNQNPADAFIAKPPSGRPVSLLVSNPLVKHINERQSPSILEVLERKIEELAEGTERKRLEQSRKMFEDLGAAVIAPIVAQGKLIALLVLGPKLSGESFGNEDLQLIEVLGPQIGSAIQKANLYEEVRAFGERLKKRVEEATAELKERNVSLLTLQTITRDVTRTLDFNKVVQNIADSVSNRLGYVGAVLVFVDDDGHTVRARAITNTPLTAKATKLLPKHFSEYATDLTNQKDRNLANDVITSGQVRFTEDFSDVISPPVPKSIAWAIQKLIGVKTIVVMPITSEQKVIGAIEIGLKKAQEDISEREIETMQSVADQLGVVARNLKLFEQVKLANAELEDANRHLQQLDQAKSEFVSIASHQLRTPMTGIMGYLSMLTSGDFGQLKVEHVRILKNLLQESQRMIRLINLFLNVTKIEAGKFEFHPVPIDLVDLVDREIREVAKLAEEKKLKLVFDRPQKPLPQVLADPDKLQDVLLNLIDNAIKYTREGSVTVRVEHGPGELVVSVHDTGVGIPKDQVSELFNKFVRGSGIARLHPDGSGLGLFIAKRIIEGHRGRIWVESQGEGRGSTFRFSLPLAH